MGQQLLGFKQLLESLMNVLINLSFVSFHRHFQNCRLHRGLPFRLPASRRRRHRNGTRGDAVPGLGQYSQDVDVPSRPQTPDTLSMHTHGHDSGFFHNKSGFERKFCSLTLTSEKSIISIKLTHFPTQSIAIAKFPLYYFCMLFASNKCLFTPHVLQSRAF